MAYKLIIADDEILECKVLEKIICENMRNIQIMPYALNGIELIAAVEKYTPDILIVDINMPGINGLDAVELILNKYQEIKVLVVSAYSKFEYAQKALFLGAIDYLLKPVKENEILKALHKICAQIDSEKQAAEEKRDMHLIFKDYRETVENEFMTSLLLGDLTEECIQKYSQFIPHSFYGAFLVCIEMRGSKNEQIFMKILDDMKKISTCSGRTQKKFLILWIAPGYFGSNEEYKKWIKMNLECVLKNRIKEYNLYVAVSQLKRDMQSAVEGYQEAKRTLGHMKIPGINFYEYKVTGERISLYTERESCKEFALQGQYDMLLDTVRRIIQYSENRIEYLSAFKVFILDLMQAILKRKERTHSTLIVSWVYWKDILSACSYEETLAALEKILDELESKQKKNQFNRYVTGSLQYILTHYTEEIDLERVAEQNKISSFYLSRLFKQEMQFTFLEILTNIRLSKAIELLFEGEYSAQQLSEKCGYMNTSYFYKLFKKQTGMTLGEMRSYIWKE